MSGAWSEAWHNVVTFLPKLAAFLVILVVGWFLAKLVGKLVDAVLERLHFDRAVERGGIKKALAGSEYDASMLVGKLVFFTLVLFVLQVAFGVFGPNPVSELLSGVIAFLPKALVAIVIVVITAAIGAAVRELVTNALGGLPYGRTLANVAAAFIIGVGVIAALNQVGIGTTVTTPILIAVLAALVGVVVVGVGGGLIKPMQARWESYLSRVEAEAPRIREEAAKASRASESAPVTPTTPAESAYAADAAYQQPTDSFDADRPQASEYPADREAASSYAWGSPDSSSTDSSSAVPSSSDTGSSDFASSESASSESEWQPSEWQPSETWASESYASERRDSDTQAFDQPSVETQIFGDEDDDFWRRSDR